MTIATRQHEYTESREGERVAGSHYSILVATKREETRCDVGDTGQTVQEQPNGLESPSVSGGVRCLVYALNSVYTGDLADIGENRLELAAVGDFKTSLDACVELVWATLQVADV